MKKSKNFARILKYIFILKYVQASVCVQGEIHLGFIELLTWFEPFTLSKLA